MKREFTIKLGDTTFPIEAEDENITVDGRAYTVKVVDDCTVLVDGITYKLAVEENEATVENEDYAIEVNGLSVSASAAPAEPVCAAPSAAGAGAVLAIMPGKIIRVMVEAGQEIKEGDPVCVLEAMKMENELNAKQDGMVKAVYVKPGDDVEKDQVLVEIE